MKYFEDELSKEEYHQMMMNAYYRLIKDETMEECLLRNNTEAIYFPFELTGAIPEKTIELIIQHFIDVEMFEEVIELKKFFKQYKPPKNEQRNHQTNVNGTWSEDF